MKDSLIGVISDTHGLVRPEVMVALAGCSLIVHAGDIGKPHVLEKLRELAPVIAVRGNVDEHKKVRAEFAALPFATTFSFAGRRVHVVHREEDIADDVSADLIVVGHSHKPELRMTKRGLLVNPGSAGPRRFSLPICCARVVVESMCVEPLCLLS